MISTNGCSLTRFQCIYVWLYSGPTCHNLSRGVDFPLRALFDHLSIQVKLRGNQLAPGWTLVHFCGKNAARIWRETRNLSPVPPCVAESPLSITKTVSRALPECLALLFLSRVPHPFTHFSIQRGSMSWVVAACDGAVSCSQVPGSFPVGCV